MIRAYFNSIASEYLGLPLLEFIAVCVVVLLVLVLVYLNRGDR